MTKKYSVLMTFQHPAWDEQDGYTYVVAAGSKREANRRARFMADDDGHTIGKRVYFKATETDPGARESSKYD